MWNEIERIFLEEGIQIGDWEVFRQHPIDPCAHEFDPDKAESFFVGDAAGRQYTKAKADFASTDRKWAQNVGLTFWTPEVRSQFSCCMHTDLPTLQILLKGIFSQISSA